MLTLYHANHSTCSQKVRLCLAEKKLSWESQLVNLATNEHLAPEYLQLNPNGVVPTLDHDGAIIRDSGVICEYLDEVFTEVPLMPRNPIERAEVREWIRYLDEVPTAAVRVPSFNMAFLPRYSDLDDKGFQKEQADVRPLRKHFYEKMGRTGFDNKAVDDAMEQLASAIARMESRLDSRAWLSGTQIGLADFIAAPLIDRLDDLGLASIWEGSAPEFLPIGPLRSA